MEIVFLTPDKKDQTIINKRGRPVKQIDPEILSAVAHLQPTMEEMASALKVSLNTLKARLEENQELQEIIDQSKNAGKLSLRRMMWKNAQGGNTTMQIWLSKQYLDMCDKQTVNTNAKIDLDLSTLTDEQLDRQIDRMKNA
jgi:hypothetical protein